MSPRTVRERVVVLRGLAKFSGVAPEHATFVDIVTWLAQGDWMPGTRYQYHSALTAWFLWLQVEQYRDDNPMIRIPRPKRSKGIPRPTSDAELDRILVSTRRERTRSMLILACLQGLRAHEIAKVRGEHVNLMDGRLEVTGKGGKTKVLPLHPDVAQLATTMPRDGYWFPGTDGGHVHRNSVSTNVSRAFRRARVSGSTHRLRHWYGSSLIDAGVNLRDVQELMRHETSASTEIYTLVPPERMARDLALLSLPTAG
ncbi:MAG: tyrosine-type recombinase/integrase [Mycobacterium sp.]